MARKPYVIKHIEYKELEYRYKKEKNAEDILKKDYQFYQKLIIP